MLNRNEMTTFTPTHDVVAEATAAGFFPPRHNVEITQVTELTDRVMRLTFHDPFIASHAKPAQFVNLFTHDDFMLMPRPFGVSEVDGDEVSVIFAVVATAPNSWQDCKTATPSTCSARSAAASTSRKTLTTFSSAADSACPR